MKFPAGQSTLRPVWLQRWNLVWPLTDSFESIRPPPRSPDIHRSVSLNPAFLFAKQGVENFYDYSESKSGSLSPTEAAGPREARRRPHNSRPGFGMTTRGREQFQI
jgi:hypothetical protein